jgi:hypothetical protein
MQATNSNSTRKEAQSEYITRTIRTKDGEVTIIERKPQPMRLNGFDV